MESGYLTLKADSIYHYHVCRIKYVNRSSTTVLLKNIISNLQPFMSTSGGWDQSETTTGGWYPPETTPGDNLLLRKMATTGGWHQPETTTGGWHQPESTTGGWYQPESTTGGWYQPEATTGGYFMG